MGEKSPIELPRAQWLLRSVVFAGLEGKRDFAEMKISGLIEPESYRGALKRAQKLPFCHPGGTHLGLHKGQWGQQYCW